MEHQIINLKFHSVYIYVYFLYLLYYLYVISRMSNAKSLMQGQAQNERSWANMANEDDALRTSLPEGPPSAAATYKAKTYLPDAPRWATRQETIAEEASAERANTPTPLRENNLEDLGINKYSYNRQRERMGLRPRPNRTSSRERRRTARRYRSPSPRRDYRRASRRRSQSPSPNRRGPVRRYGVGRSYVAAPGFGSRHRSPSPRRRSPSPRRRSPSPRRRSPSPRRRSPSPRYSRRRSPSVNEFGRNLTRNYRPRRGPSPLRYTVAANGRTVNEFGRNVSRTEGRWPRSNGTRGRRRPIHVFDEKTKRYKPANWNI